MIIEIPQKIIYPIPKEELGTRQDENAELKIRDPSVLKGVMVAMTTRLINNGHKGIHCFFIDGRWLLPEGGYRIKINGKEHRIGGGDADARRYFLHPQRRLFVFRGAPVYLIDEINCGQYDIKGSAMGWVGVLAVPS